MSWRRWVVPPVVLGVLVYGTFAVILSRQVGALLPPTPPKAQELPDPCGLVTESTVSKAAPGAAAFEPRMTEESLGDEIPALLSPYESELLLDSRACRWADPGSETEGYPDSARGLHIVLKQYESPREARHFFRQVVWGTPVDLAGADRALLRTTELWLAHQGSARKARKVDSSTSSVLAQRGNLLVFVIAGMDDDTGKSTNRQDWRQLREGVRRIANEVLGHL